MKGCGSKIVARMLRPYRFIDISRSPKNPL
jgi:hypothetical protein